MSFFIAVQLTGQFIKSRRVSLALLSTNKANMLYPHNGCNLYYHGPASHNSISLLREQLSYLFGGEGGRRIEGTGIHVAHDRLIKLLCFRLLPDLLKI